MQGWKGSQGRLRLFLILFAAWISGGCVFLVRQVGTYQVPLTVASTHTEPLKVQMTDGSVVLFQGGGTVAPNGVSGRGTRRGMDGATSAVTSIPADSVTAVHAFRTEISTGKSVGASALATGLIVGAVAMAATKEEPRRTDNSGCATNGGYGSYSSGVGQ